MATYEDYKLEDAEDAAMKKSQTAKRAILATAGIASVGGAAFAADAIYDHTHPSTDGLSAQDLNNGLEAGTINDDVLEPEPAPAPTTATKTAEVNTPTPEPAEPDVQFNSTITHYDVETGEQITLNQGTIDGTDFEIVDLDGDGRADIMGVDINGNHILEENEYEMIDNSYNIQMQETDKELIVIHTPSYNDSMPENEYIEEYEDLAYNNPDYNNGVEYSAEIDDTAIDTAADEYLAEDSIYAEDPMDIMTDDTVGLA